MTKQLRYAILVYVYLILGLIYLSNSEVKDEPSSIQLSHIQLKSKFLINGSEGIQNYTMPMQMLDLLELNQKNITLSEIQSNGNSAIITPGGTRIPILILGNFLFVNFTLFHDQNMHLLMNDIKGDPDLAPVEEKPLKWVTLRKCQVKSLFIYNNLVSFFMINGRVNKTFVKEEEGLVLIVVNAQTCKITLQKNILTNHYGIYRDLLSTVKNILPGRVVILSSQIEGSLLLHKTARQYLASIGSLFAEHYMHNDAWIWVFVKDGASIGETLIPNLGSTDNYGSPVTFDVKIPQLKTSHNFSNQAAINVYESWPNQDQWIYRRKFCSQEDGIKSLCTSDLPFQLKAISEVEQNASNFAPVLILSEGNRLQLLMRLMESLSGQANLTKESIILVLDRNSEKIRQLATILEVRVLIRKPDSQKHGATRVSRTLRFGLFNALRIFPEAKYFIVLEDDLIVSPDFYSYMQYLAPLFEMDSSIYCISGFNFLSTPKTSHDPTMTYRFESHPSYGWMMSRALVKEFLPKWPHKQFLHDWDHIFASDFMRQERHCIAPDVNRVYHNCIENSNAHYIPTWLTEKEFLKREINQLKNVNLQPLNRMLEKAYWDETERLISSATLVTVDNPYNITWPTLKSNAYVVYVKMKGKNDYDSFRVLSDGLGTWTRSPKFGFYHYSWRMFYNVSALFIIGVPISPFSRFLLPGSKVFSATPEDVNLIPKEEPVLKFVTHQVFNQNEIFHNQIQIFNDSVSDF